MKIGNFNTKGNIFLAPMAGVTDLPFRIMCKKYNCSLVYTEMINAKAVCYNDKNTFEMLETIEEEGDVIVQIFGSEPAFMRESASIISGLDRFKAIDINMGCPVPKVVKNGEGSALLKNPKLASEIIREVKKGSKIPVTVKIRIGWDDNSINAVEFAKMVEDSGADALAVHGRTREQYYSGKANWEIIANVKKVINIPLIANGDIFTIEDAIKIKEITEADGYMIGRGAQGNPFIFKQFHHYENTGEVLEISPSEKIDIIISHYKQSLKYKGEQKTIREMRKHIGWYIKGLKGSAKFRNDINHIEEVDKVYEMLHNFKKELLD